MGLVSHGHKFQVCFLLTGSQKCMCAFRPLLCHWIPDGMPEL